MAVLVAAERHSHNGISACDLVFGMDETRHQSWLPQAALWAGLLWAVYGVTLCVYRLKLHPLSGIPGPKLAAMTAWVETYYECFKAPGGVFMWEYQKWHDQYGPIVRIGPDEVHIQDPTFYETLFAQSRHSDKLKKLENRFNNRMSSFGTSDHGLHRMRRGALNPFFSKRRIAQEAPGIQAHMDRLCRRVESEFAGNGSVLSLSNMWGAFTSDTVAHYCFAKPYDFILKPDFRAEFCDAMVSLVDPVHFITQFPWVMKGLQRLPDWLVKMLSPQMRPIMDFNDEMEQQILRVKAARAGQEKSMSLFGRKSLFSALLESGLPPEELSVQRLQHEAISVIGAGLETTMFALSVASFHVLANPSILHQLQAELATAIPDPNNMPGLDTLMQLPHLTNVINEALRFAYGTSQRIPRLSPTPMTYTPPMMRGGPRSDGFGPDASYVLPVGTVVSMDNFTASHDAWLYPEPFEFRPSRWHGNATAPDGKPLTRYLFAFGRGTRSCVGMQLAYAELYIGLASFFRRFRCVLFETERDAVDVHMDRFAPKPKPGTKGVRVQVVATM